MLPTDLPLKSPFLSNELRHVLWSLSYLAPLHTSQSTSPLLHLEVPFVLLPVAKEAVTDDIFKTCSVFVIAE